MMSPRACLLAAVLALACKRVERAPIASDPTPSSSATLDHAAPKASSSAERYAIFHGHLVDRRDGKELRTFPDAGETAQVVSGDRAYVSTSTASTIAWDVTAARAVWTIGDACTAMAALEGGLLCGRAVGDLSFLDAADGAVHVVERGGSKALQIVVHGDRALVVRDDSTVESFDVHGWKRVGVVTLAVGTIGPVFVDNAAGISAIAAPSASLVFVDPDAHAARVLPYPFAAPLYYASPRQLDAHYAVVASPDVAKTSLQTIVLRAQDFTPIVTLPVVVAAAIPTDDGALDALLSQEKSPRSSRRTGARVGRSPTRCRRPRAPSRSMTRSSSPPSTSRATAPR